MENYSPQHRKTMQKPLIMDLISIGIHQPITSQFKKNKFFDFILSYITDG